MWSIPLVKGTDCKKRMPKDFLITGNECLKCRVSKDDTEAAKFKRHENII